MTFERREELISAFLDGELAPQERAQVEKWLAESPELRQLHDELAALGGSLRSLPRHQLGRNLSEIVLRRAERAVLGDNTERPIAGKVGPSALASSWWSRGAGWRRLVWPAVAVAAALVIMFFTSDERSLERQVAQAPKDQGSIAARDHGAAAPAVADSQPAQRTDEYATDKTAVEQRHARQAKPGDVQMLARPVAGLAPAESSPAAAGAPAPKSEAVGGARSRAKSVEPLREAIVCDVTPEFLQAKSFEKLLAELNMVAPVVEPARPLNVAVAEVEDQPAPAAKAVEPSAARLRQSYVVEATDEQMARLVAQLRKNTTHVKKISDERRLEDKQEGDRGEQARSRSYRFILQAPADAPSPPADGEDKP